jgi:cellulose synthase operon protein C
MRARAQDVQKQGPAQDIAAATRALREGRYGEVEAILHEARAGDGERAALRGRAAVATGAYARAREILQPAAARQPLGDAALQLGLLHLRLGHRGEATELLAPLLRTGDSPAPDDLLRAGLAARALGEFETANDLLRAAAEASPGSTAINTAWGELFLEKYNGNEARRCFEAAVGADPRNADAWLGLARLASDSDVATALGAVRHALDANPSSVDALVVLAHLLLDAGYPEGARESLRRALEINASSLEVHAYLAAIARLDNRTADFETSMRRALAINPGYGESYRIVAAQLAAHNRFDEAVELARKAVALEPGNSRARAELGMDLLRTGEEDQARTVLESALDADPYNVVTYNLLSVLDALRTFETIRDGDIVLRLDRREAAVLKEPVLSLAHEALRVLSARYGFTPRGPILIEVFPHHDDFAVRNLGIPGLVGALGACFGRVVTLDSPRARPPGAFDWSATLWHELAHVITLQMSQQRVPRWLTEGVSVYEEQRARPEWRRPMDEVFARALNARMVPALADIDASFGDPRRIGLAYYHAGQVVRYLLDAYGQDRFNTCIRAFADGSDTDAAFTRAFGVNVDQAQAGLERGFEASFGALRRALRAPSVPIDGASMEQLKGLVPTHPGSYDVHMALGAALRAAGDDAGARNAYARAAELFPMAAGSDSPHAVLAEMAVAQGDQAAAVVEMEKELAAEPTNIELARRMVGIMGSSGSAPPLRRAYERIVALDPFDASAHAAFARLAVRGGDVPAAVREFKAALAAGVPDAAGARCDLAEAYLLAADKVSAKREVLAVLEVAPTHERAQELLLKLVEGGR